MKISLEGSSFFGEGGVVKLKYKRATRDILVLEAFIRVGVLERGTSKWPFLCQEKRANLV